MLLERIKTLWLAVIENPESRLGKATNRISIFVGNSHIRKDYPRIGLDRVRLVL